MFSEKIVTQTSVLTKIKAKHFCGRKIKYLFGITIFDFPDFV